MVERCTPHRTPEKLIKTINSRIRFLEERASRELEATKNFDGYKDAMKKKGKLLIHLSNQINKFNESEQKLPYIEIFTLEGYALQAKKHLQRNNSVGVDVMLYSWGFRPVKTELDYMTDRLAVQKKAS